MCPKFPENAKKEAGRQRKATQAAERRAKEEAKKEAEEVKKWAQGTKDTSRMDQREQQRLEKIQKRAELKALEAQEEADIVSAYGTKGQNKQSCIRNSEEGEEERTRENGNLIKPVIDKHPERRIKSAFAEYEEQQLPLLKQTNPHLRHSQLKELIRKAWKKAPENPYNKSIILPHNATREQERMVTEMLNETIDAKLKVSFKEG